MQIWPQQWSPELRWYLLEFYATEKKQSVHAQNTKTFPISIKYEQQEIKDDHRVEAHLQNHLAKGKTYSIPLKPCKKITQACNLIEQRNEAKHCLQPPVLRIQKPELHLESKEVFESNYIAITLLALLSEGHLIHQEASHGCSVCKNLLRGLLRHSSTVCH